MTLLRATARTLLSSYFVVSGIRAIRNPDDLAEAAEPLVDAVVPAAQRLAPEQVGDLIPDDAKSWVRINGLLQVVGGAALATGKGRRLGAALLALSLVPTTIGKYPFWKRAQGPERSGEFEHFLKNISLLGGVLIAARDTEGKPSISYRVNKTSKALADTRKAGRKVSKETRQLTDAALAEGALLVGTVVGSTRKARKQLAAAEQAAAKQAIADSEAAAKAAKLAAKDAAKEAAKDAAKEAAKSSRTKPAQPARASAAAKQPDQRAADTQPSTGGFSENIELGEN